MKTSKKITFEAECETCGGTGLYQGFMESSDEAVVCVNCRGTGCAIVNLKPFIGRKKKRGIKKVRFGSGLAVDSPIGSAWFPYEEFLYNDFIKKVPSQPKNKATKRKKAKK